jgi:hypothetical protein
MRSPGTNVTVFVPAFFIVGKGAIWYEKSERYPNWLHSAVEYTPPFQHCTSQSPRVKSGQSGPEHAGAKRVMDPLMVVPTTGEDLAGTAIPVVG